MYLIDQWNVFRAVSDKNKKCLDQISIDELNKRFILDIEAVDYFTEDCEDWYRFSDSVSRFVFDLILDGIKEKGFTQLIAENKIRR